jgi:hypothetical protein
VKRRTASFSNQAVWDETWVARPPTTAIIADSQSCVKELTSLHQNTCIHGDKITRRQVRSRDTLSGEVAGREVMSW